MRHAIGSLFAWAVLSAGCGTGTAEIMVRLYNPGSGLKTPPIAGSELHPPLTWRRAYAADLEDALSRKASLHETYFTTDLEVQDSFGRDVRFCMLATDFQIEQSGQTSRYGFNVKRFKPLFHTLYPNDPRFK